MNRSITEHFLISLDLDADLADTTRVALGASLQIVMAAEQGMAHVLDQVEYDPATHRRMRRVSAPGHRFLEPSELDMSLQRQQRNHVISMRRQELLHNATGHIGRTKHDLASHDTLLRMLPRHQACFGANRVLRRSMSLRRFFERPLKFNGVHVKRLFKAS